MSHVRGPRLDVALVERGLAPTRAKAQAWVLAGEVLVDGARADKAGRAVADAETLEVRPARRFVGRGGDKLDHALTVLGVDVAGAHAIDVGASTGGFTDCLLSRGAASVLAVDVGYGQLDPTLRADPRVTVRERTNVRRVRVDELAVRPDLCVMDVSFTSVASLARAVVALLDPSGWRAVVLVKPQFEAGRGAAPRGVVRDPAVRLTAVTAAADALEAAGGRVVGAADSGLPGARGNREVFVSVTLGEPADRAGRDALLRTAVLDADAHADADA